MFKNSVFKTSTDTKQWFKAAGIRAVKTTAQAAVALIPAAATIMQVDWATVAGYGTACRNGIHVYINCGTAGSKTIGESNYGKSY